MLVYLHRNPIVPVITFNIFLFSCKLLTPWVFCNHERLSNFLNVNWMAAYFVTWQLLLFISHMWHQGACSITETFIKQGEFYDNSCDDFGDSYFRLWWFRWFIFSIVMISVIHIFDFDDFGDSYFRLWWFRWFIFSIVMTMMMIFASIHHFHLTFSWRTSTQQPHLHVVS